MSTDTTPTNYKETEVIGSKYKRAFEVKINNPKDGKPSLYINEQDCIQLGTETIYRNCGTLYCELNRENPLHMEIYEKLNQLYVELRTERDNRA